MVQLYARAGGEFLVDTATAGSRIASSIDAASGGGSGIVWQDFSGRRGDGDGAIKGQRFDAAAPQAVYLGGNEFLVNTTTQGDQRAPQSARLANGNLIITWTAWDAATGYVQRAQLYDGNGVRIGGEFAIDAMKIAALPGGGFVTTWARAPSTPHDIGDIYAQLYDDAGHKVGAQIPVNTFTLAAQLEPSIAALADGGFVVAWVYYEAHGFLSDVFALRFDVGGAKMGTEQLVSNNLLVHQNGVEVAALADGGFVATWVDNGGLKAMIFNAAGNRVGGEFTVTATAPVLEPHVAGLASGGFVIAWAHDNTFNYYTYADDLSLQVFDAAGSKVGSEILVDPTAPLALSSVDVTALDSGGFVLTWAGRDGDPTNSAGIVGQVFDPTGARIGTPFIANTTIAGGQIHSNVILLDGDRFLVSWTDMSQSGADTDGMAVRARIFGPDAHVPPVGAPPHGADATLSTNEDVARILATADFGFGDQDGDAFAGVLIATAPTHGWLVLNGTAIGAGSFVDTAQLAAGQLAFMPGADEYGTDYGSFTFQVRDSSCATDPTPNTIHFDVAPIRDAPRIAWSVNSFLYLEGNDPRPIDISGYTIVTDPDSADFAGGSLRVSITNGIASQDVLGIANAYGVQASGKTAGSSVSVNGTVIGTIASGGTGAHGEDLVVAFNASANAASVTAMIHAVTYWNSSDAVVESTREFTFTLNDGDGPELGTATAKVGVMGWPDAPVLTGPTEPLLHVLAGSVSAPLFAGVTLTDPDGPNASGGNLYITTYGYSNYPNFLVLTGTRFTESNGALMDNSTGLQVGTVYRQENLGVVFSQGTTLDVVNAVAQAFAFSTTPVSTLGVEKFYLGYTDTSLGSNQVTQSVSIEPSAASSKPVVDLNGPQPGLSSPVIYTENDFPTPLGNDIRVTGPNGGDAIDGMTIVLHGWDENDVFSYGGGVPFGISLATSGDASTRTMTFSGTATAADYRQALASVLFKNSSEKLLDGHSSSRWFEVSVQSQGVSSDVVRVDLTIAWVDDPASARDDRFTTGKATVLTGNVLSDNGAGEDSDVDSPLLVTGMNGGALSADAVVLPSGALLRLNADGTFRYDPNHAFSGHATDRFTYTLQGGGSATVTIHITADGGGGSVPVTGSSGPDTLNGASGPDVIDGGGGDDIIFVQQGGIDQIRGGAGNDAFYFGAVYGAGDTADGGTGADTLVLQGNYAGLSLAGISNVEVLLVASGSDTRFGDTAGNAYAYRLASVDSNIVAGGNLTVNGTGLQPAENLAFDGSAETNGHFRIFGGQGVDDLKGGGGSDGFFFGADGNLTGADRVEGGAGTDSIAMRGNYAGANAVAFQPASFTGVEIITFLSGHTNEYGGPIASSGFDYDVTIANGNVAAGSLLQVIGVNLRADESLRFDGRAETDGSLRILSGAGGDRLFGGAGNDTLYGALGADQLDGGAGADTYLYRTSQDSTAASRDTIAFGAGDRIDLSLIDANSATAANDAFAFIGANAFTGTAGELRAWQSGASWFVEGDVNGDGAADFVLAVTASAPIASDFVL